MSTFYTILKQYNLEKTNGLIDQLQGYLTDREKTSFENGVRERRATQAKLELQGRDRFLTELRAQNNSLKEIIQKVLDEN